MIQLRGIFENEDLSKFLLFSYIERVPRQAITIKEIQNKFNLSKFKATSLIEELINDFNSFNLYNFFNIEKHGKEYVYSKNGLDSVNRLFWIYGRRSLKLRYLDYFIKNPKCKIEDFSFQYFVSVSRAYTIRKELFEYLDSYKINFFRDDGLEEYKIRYFLSSIYFSIFKEYEFPCDEEMLTKVNDFLIRLKSTNLLENVNGLELSRIKLYIYITILRIETDNTYEENINLLHEVDEEVFEKIKEVMGMILKEKAGAVTSETILLINYLLSLEFLKFPSQLRLTNKYKEHLDKLLFVFFDGNNLEEFKDELRQSLSPLFIKTIYYRNVVQDDLFFADMSVFNENYSDIFKLAANYLKNLDVISVLGDISKNKSFLMVFILKIIEVINLNKILKNVVVSVNFSISKEYNNFISTIISNLPFSNLTVLNEYKECTDLYLTDTLTENIDCYCIVWNSPPTGKDWEIFGNVISEIKNTK